MILLHLHLVSLYLCTH